MGCLVLFLKTKTPTLICCFFPFAALLETDYFLSRDLSNAIKGLLEESGTIERNKKNVTFDQTRQLKK